MCSNAGEWRGGHPIRILIKVSLAFSAFYCSTKNDEALNPIVVNTTEGYRHLWAKNQAALRYLHQHHSATHHWFLKADDDTYVILENLRHFLKEKNTSDPIYYGVKFKQHVKQVRDAGIFLKDTHIFIDCNNICNKIYSTSTSCNC